MLLNYAKKRQDGLDCPPETSQCRLSHTLSGVECQWRSHNEKDGWALTEGQKESPRAEYCLERPGGLAKGIRHENYHSMRTPSSLGNSDTDVNTQKRAGR